MENFFDVLAVAADATDAAVRQAYLRLARQCHPDKGREDAPAGFVRVRRAYEALRTAAQRRQHAEALRAFPPGAQAQLTGLQARPDLNGALVTVGHFNGRRYEVRLAAGDTVSVRPPCLSAPVWAATATATAGAGWAFATAHASTWAAPATAAGEQATASARTSTGAAHASAWAGVARASATGHAEHATASAQASSGTARAAAWAQAHPAPAAAPPAPALGSAPWTADEMAMAASLHADSRLPAAARDDIYSAVDDTAAYPVRLGLVAAELARVARAFQIAAQWRRDQGDFLRLEARLEEGKKGMCALVVTDEHRDGRRAEYYEKTAGDMLQTYWCKVGAVPHSHYFGFNVCQAAVAKWLALPYLICRDRATAQFVSGWDEHGVADLHETLTLHLQPSLLHTYLTVTAAYHHLFLDNGASSSKCAHWDALAGLCWKGAAPGQRRCRAHRAG